MSAAKKWAVPPGYRDFADTLQEYGRDHMETNLVSGQWPAFKLDLYSGELEPIPPTAWCATRGLNWLKEGKSQWLDIFHLPDGVKVTDYALVLRVSERDADKPKVRLAKELMAAAFSQGEWRQMGVRAVRKGCEQEAKRGEVQLPSPDSFSRAMGRRRK